MSRKRFEQIETSEPDDPGKKSLLDKFKFKRKLELDGIEREKLPIEPTTAPVQNQEPQTPQVQRSRQQPPVLTRTRITPNKPKVADAKGEFDSLVQEIEIAEQRKLAGQPQQKVVHEKKKFELDRKIQLDMAKQKAQKAKSTLFWSFIGLAVAAVIFYQLSKTNLIRGGGLDLVLFVVSIVAAILGRRRGRWW